MRTSRKLTSTILALLALVLMSSAALAADPGLLYPPTSEVSDQKAGSVLIYNYYTSSATASNTENTRINITNTSSTSAAFVHLFFVASNCAVADAFICLTANQTASFLTSDFDPGFSGYIVAIASDGVLGCPVSFNHLIGDEYIKRTSGHTANLGAEAIAALYTGILPGCDANSTTATVIFNGVVGSGYNRVPRALAVSNVPSRVDGNDTLVIINRTGGNLATGAGSIGNIFGLFYDDAENVLSYSISGGCQKVFSITDAEPRLVPRFTTFIPAGRSGWTKFWPTSDVGVLGAVINFNPNAAAQANAFNGGHNLHKLTLTVDAYVLPIFPPSC